MKENILNNKLLKNFISLTCELFRSFSYNIYFSLITIYQFLPAENNMRVLFLLVSIPFICYKLFNTKYTIKELGLYFALGIIILLGTITSGREAYLLLFISIIGAKNIDIKKIIKNFFIVGGTVYFLVVLYGIYYYFLNFDSIEKSIRYMFNIKLYIQKYSLGYSHANLTFALYFSLVMAYIYIKDGILNIIELFISIIIGVILFYFTFSRTGFIILLLSFFFLNIIKRVTYYKFLNWIPSFIIILSFTIPYLFNYYSNSFFRTINLMLSDRIRLSFEFIQFFVPKLFGQNVDDITGYSEWYLKCDNSFVLTLYAYGILLFIILIIFTLFISKLNLNRIEIFLICIFYLYGFTESFFLTVTFNFSLLFFCKFINSNEERELKILEHLKTFNIKKEDKNE